MAEAVSGIASVVETLNQRICELEQRVTELEQRAESGRVRRAKVVASEATNWPPKYTTPPPATWRGFPPVDTPAGAASSTGKAVLGLAGAFMLRAIAESGSFPKLPVVILGVLYAVFWMWLAVYRHRKNGFASVTFAITSTLILIPLVWESTLRFEVLSPVLSGGVLIGFVLLTLGLTWNHELYAIPWIAVVAVVTQVFALIVVTHDLVPLAATTLILALVIEISACFGRHLTLRAVPAFSVNISILLLLDFLTSPDGVPPGYHAASDRTLTALFLAPLVIYSCSVAIRTLFLRKKITVFETMQGVCAFVISVFGSIRASHGLITPVLDISILALAAACYWGAFSRFAGEQYERNRRTFSIWAAALLLGGILLFPSNFKIICLCAASLGTVYAFQRTAKMSLALHSTFFLTAALVVSPLLDYIVNALAGPVPGFPSWSAWLIVACAAICYYEESQGPKMEGYRRAMWVIPATIVSFALAAFTVAAIIGNGARLWDGSAPRLSVVRTLVNCALALALGYLRCRWNRVELGWIAYLAVLFGSIKLLFEDLRYGSASSLVFSFLFYGLVLVLLPQLVNRTRRINDSGHGPEQEKRSEVSTDRRAMHDATERADSAESATACPIANLPG